MLTYLILKSQPIQYFKCLVVKKYCEWEKGGFGNTIYMCVCAHMYEWGSGLWTKVWSASEVKQKN